MLLEHDLGLAEPLLDEEDIGGLPRLGLGGGDDHALAGREAVGLEHCGIRGACEVVSCLLPGMQDRVRCGGNPRRAHELLGVDLRALDPGRLRAGPERGDAAGLERIDQAGHQRRLWTHDDEIDALGRGGVDDRANVFGADLETARVRRDARVAGSAQQLDPLRRAGQGAHDRVLAPAAADDQDAHEGAPGGVRGSW